MNLPRASFIAVVVFVIAACAAQPSTPPVAGDRMAGSRVASARAPQPAISPQLLVSETFANGSTQSGAWFYSAGACLTADATPPPQSIPSCGKLAPRRPVGHGALQLTPPITNTVALAGWNTPLPTAHGLEIKFTSFAYEGTGADGTLLFFTDGAHRPPSEPAEGGGCLGYYGGGECEVGGLEHAYLGVAFDESGVFEQVLYGGNVRNTIALAGWQSTPRSGKKDFPYLGGYDDAQGRPASLPYPLANPQATKRQSDAPMMDVTLDANGLVNVAIDFHNHQGFVNYVSRRIVGIDGQPRVPKSVYVGIIGSNGGAWERRQIDDLTIATHPTH